MAYYIIDTKTNKINPNAILGEVALYQTEQNYINANNPNHRPATKLEIQQYTKDYLLFKKNKEKRTDIVLSFKKNPSIKNTIRVNIDNYLLGQIQEEVFGMEYMYIETTGNLLTTFIANEQEAINNNKDKQIKDCYHKTVAKIIATQNTVLSDFTGIINGITLNKLSVDRIIELCTLIEKTEDQIKTDKIFSLNCAVYFDVNKKDIVGKYLPIISTVKKKVHDNSGAVIAKALTLANNKDLVNLQALFDSITPELLDGDNVKDGKISIIIDDETIKVFKGDTQEEITKNIAEIQKLVNLTV